MAEETRGKNKRHTSEMEEILTVRQTSHQMKSQYPNYLKHSQRSITIQKNQKSCQKILSKNEDK